MLRKAPWAIPLLLAVVALAAFAPFAESGTTGKLTGRARGEKNEPLPGVNIRIEGQRLGAVTDEQGNYTIIGVPAGTHMVRANLIGYAPFVATGVTITPDFNTDLNIQLKTEAVQLNEVRVEAERPLLQKDATGTTRFIDSETIHKMPTRGYRDAAAQQTGVVNFQRQIDNEAGNSNTLIIRGGRPNETAYYVDGFSQQDPLTGTSSTAISGNAIEEIVLLTGGFTPEYGRIMSGAVNVITREGGSKYFGALEAVSDVLSGDWVKASRVGYDVYDASLGGPIIPGHDNLTFYFSGERRWQRDRSPSPMAGLFKQNLSILGVDPDFKPSNSSSAWAGQAKIAYQVSDQLSFKAGGIGSQDDWRQYLNSYLFNLQHAPRYFDKNQTYFVTGNQVFNSRMFANLGVNFSQTDRKRGDGVHFDRLGEYYRPSNPTIDPNLPMFWKAGHVWDDYLQRRSSYWGAQGAVTSQFDRYNQVKLGADYQHHTLRYFDAYFPTQIGGSSPDTVDWDGYGYNLVLDRNAAGNVVGSHLEENSDSDRDGAKHPKAFSLFAQDRYERGGVIINGGLRYDNFNVDTPSLRSQAFPLGSPEDQPDSLRGRLDAGDLEKNKVYSRLSPRLGIAFPLDEMTVLRFNYGQFYQQPNLQDLYVSYRFLEYKINRGGYFVGFGNPDLKPERTTAYEVGAQRQFGSSLRVDLTAYYKDVKDLVEITTVSSRPKAFSSYRNRDFATIKGVDMGVKMRPTSHFSGELNYSLSFAQGTGSVSQSQRNIAWTGSEVPKQSAPLDFDQRHKISFNLDVSTIKGEGPAVAGFRPFENSSLNILYNVASGTPYTPTTVYNEVTLAAVASQPSGPLNSRYGPWTSSIDFKAIKGIGFGALHLETYVWVLNLLDAKNATTVYTSSGSANTTGWLESPDGRAFLQSTGDVGLERYRLAENNPNLYSNPRLVRFGIRTSF